MKRRGTTLVEMLVIMAMTTLLMAAGTMLLSTLLKHYGRQRDGYHELQVTAKFAEAFRRDARAAKSAVIEDAGNAKLAKLTLTDADDKTVQYIVTEGGVDRVAAQKAGVVGREFFRLESLKELHFQRTEGDRVLTCLWQGGWQGPRGEAVVQRPHRIDACLSEEVADE